MSAKFRPSGLHSNPGEHTQRSSHTNTQKKPHTDSQEHLQQSSHTPPGQYSLSRSNIRAVQKALPDSDTGPMPKLQAQRSLQSHTPKAGQRILSKKNLSTDSKYASFDELEEAYEAPHIAEQAHRVVSLLHRSYQAFGLYPFNHKIVQQFCQDLFRELQQFFQYKKHLTLRLERFCIYYKDELLLEDQSPSNNYIFLLYSDGIRRLIFHEDLTLDECIQFFDILHFSSRSRSLQDDIVTLLWEHHFDNIEYYLLEDLTEMYIPQLEELYQDLEGFDAGNVMGQVSGGEIAVHAAASLSRSRLQLNEAERQQLIHYVADEEEGLVKRFFEILSLVFAYTKEHPDLDSLVRLLKHLQPLLLGFDDPEHILRFLELIDKLMLVFQHRESRQAKAWLLSLEEIKHQATNRQAIRELIRKYEKHPTDQRTREIIQRYVNFLTPHDAKPLLDGFAECRNKQTEEFWSNVLAKRFEHQPKMLMPGIRTHAEPLVIQTCRILGKTGNAEALSLLDRASQHAHPLVRCEALTAIVKLDLKDASAVRIRNILEAHILDEDPQVKLNVLRQLPLTPKHGIRLLQQVLEEKWYESWSKEVLKVLASSIAKIGKKQPALLDTLIRVLEERYKGLFSGMKNQDFPRFVLHALFHESSLPTQRALQQLQKSPAKILRKLSKELSKG